MSILPKPVVFGAGKALLVVAKLHDSDIIVQTISKLRKWVFTMWLRSVIRRDAIPTMTSASVCRCCLALTQLTEDTNLRHIHCRQEKYVP